MYSVSLLPISISIDKREEEIRLKIAKLKKLVSEASMGEHSIDRRA